MNPNHSLHSPSQPGVPTGKVVEEIKEGNELQDLTGETKAAVWLIPPLPFLRRQSEGMGTSKKE